VFALEPKSRRAPWQKLRQQLKEQIRECRRSRIPELSRDFLEQLCRLLAHGVLARTSQRSALELTRVAVGRPKSTATDKGAALVVNGRRARRNNKADFWENANRALGKQLERGDDVIAARKSLKSKLEQSAEGQLLYPDGISESTMGRHVKSGLARGRRPAKI
jgi:hypothetical protein